MRHCETCTCGMTHVTWSDRESWIDASNPDEVADVVIHCALDHSYDRTPDGVPWGLSEKVRERLAPIVKEHLTRVRPNWREQTVNMTDTQRAAFRVALIKALT